MLAITRPSGAGGGPRYFVKQLSARPIEWVGARLSNLEALLEQAGMAAADVGNGDAEALRQAVSRATGSGLETVEIAASAPHLSHSHAH